MDKTKRVRAMHAKYNTENPQVEKEEIFAKLEIYEDGELSATVGGFFSFDKGHKLTKKEKKDIGEFLYYKFKMDFKSARQIRVLTVSQNYTEI